jgi:hypothetical protein
MPRFESRTGGRTVAISLSSRGLGGIAFVFSFAKWLLTGVVDGCLAAVLSASSVTYTTAIMWGGRALAVSRSNRPGSRWHYAAGLAFGARPPGGG